MQKYDVAAYVWPAYTQTEERSRMFWPEGIGEWQTVKNAVSKFPGHNWPRKPLWGYVDEADPYVMEMEIQAAIDHGVNVFIYDWYWYDGRPFQENCLNDGFLKARNRNKMKFYLMWANHDFNHICDIRLSASCDEVIWKGSVDRQEFERLARRAIDLYFTQPNYYRIDGKPVFQIYDLGTLIHSLGGYEETADALAWFRQETVAAGFPELYLMQTLWNVPADPTGAGADTSLTYLEAGVKLGFSGGTHYEFVHFTDVNREYQDILADAKKEWAMLEQEYPLPYYPHVSMGWDNNPRFCGPILPAVVKNNTPEQIKEALYAAKEYTDAHPGQQPLVVINSWNEWTESSYLEPDTLYGYGYLNAVADIFRPDRQTGNLAEIKD